MPAPINPFPLNITTKQDSWDKLQLLLHLDPSLKLTAAEINKIVQALEYINNNLVTGGYTGNVPLSIVAVAIDHSASGAPAEKIKTVLNSGPNIPLQDGATQWFSTKRMVLTNGAGINNGEPGGANYAVITEYFWLRKKIPLIGGIASLGTGGTALETADIVPLFTIDTRNLAPQEFDLGNIGSTAVWTAANTSGPRSTPNTATIIFKAVQSGAPKVWLYIGQQENVGIGYPAVGTADFRIFPADGVGTDPAPAPAQRIYKFYDDVAELIIRQREQTGNELIRLTNASADPNITFPAGETRLQAYYRYKVTTNGTMADYELISAPYGMALAPKVTADTGTAIDLGWIFGNECNMLSANSNSAFTLTNIKPGGEATVLINRATEPTVTGATKISGHTFQANTNMHLKVKCRQTGIVQYYFLKLT